jgi:hypothetical protein
MSAPPLALPSEDVLRPFREAARTYLADAKALAVGDDESLGEAVRRLSEIASTNRRAEDARKDLVKPLNEHVRRVNEIFRDVMAPVEEAERLVKQKVGGYQEARRKAAEAEARLAEEERRRREEEAERARVDARAATRAVSEAETLPEFYERQDAAQTAKTVAAAAADLAAEPIPVAPPPPKTVEAGGARATTRLRWAFRVSDRAKVPRAFLVVDEKAIRAAMGASRDAEGRPLPIPGVEFFQEADVSVTPAPPPPPASPSTNRRRLGGGKYGW